MAVTTDIALRNQVMYSVFVRNHTEEGTFQALIRDLDRIRNLGVDIIWLLCCSGTGVYEILPGFVIGGIAAIVVTKLSPAPGKEVTDIFDNAIAEGEQEE